MSGPELLPCPFCGGDARTWQDPSHSTAWFCGCDDDGCFGHMHWDIKREVAAYSWNRRADLALPLAAEAMREACLAAAEISPDWTAGIAENLLAVADRIRALPTPDHAAILAAAMRLPEIAGLVDEMEWAAPILRRALSHPNDQWAIDQFCKSLSALKDAKP